MFLRAVFLFCVVFSSAFMSRAEELATGIMIPDYNEVLNRKVRKGLEKSESKLEAGDFMSAYREFKASRIFNPYNVNIFFTQKKLAEAFYREAKNDGRDIHKRRIFLEIAEELEYGEKIESVINKKIKEGLEECERELKFGDWISAFQEFEAIRELNPSDESVISFQKKFAKVLYKNSQNNYHSSFMRSIFLEKALELGYRRNPRVFLGAACLAIWGR